MSQTEHYRWWLLDGELYVVIAAASLAGNGRTA